MATTFLLADRCNAQDSTFGFDLNGKPVERLEGQGTKGIVLLFLASDCAISNRYLPEIMRLQSKFAPQGIMFWLVYPNAGETPDALRHHLKTYGVEVHTVLDPQHKLVALAQAKVTAEAAVLVKANGEQGWLNLSTAYHGRIDNRYVEIGKERPSATEHDLEQAIDATLTHLHPTPAGGPAVGWGSQARDEPQKLEACSRNDDTNRGVRCGVRDSSIHARSSGHGTGHLQPADCPNLL